MSEMGGSAAHLGGLILNQANQVVVTDAANQFNNARTALRYGSDVDGVHTPGYTEIMGKNVGSVMGADGKPSMLNTSYVAQLKAAGDKISAGLTPVQQRMFAMHVDNGMGEFNNEVSAHQAQQLSLYTKTVNSDTLASAANGMASLLPQMNTPQFETLAATQQSNADAAIDQILARDGALTLDPTTNKPVFADANSRLVYDTERKALMGKFVSTIVQAGVENKNAPQAMLYLQSQKDNLSQVDFDKIHQQVASAAMGTTAMSQVDSVLANVWTDHTKAPDEEAIDAQLRATNSNDSDQLQASRGEVHTRIANWGFTKAKTETESTQSADGDIAAGKSISYIMSQPYWQTMNGSQKLQVTDKVTSFSDGLIGHSARAAGRSGDLDAEIINYAMQAHNLSEPQARALAALSVGEGGQVDNRNAAGGGHGAYGLFQIRDSGGQQKMLQEYGAHPTKQQQIDFFLKEYSKGNSGFFNSSNEIDAFKALAANQRAGDSGTQGILQRGYGALQPPERAQQDKQDHAVEGTQALADISTNGLSNIGAMTDKNVASIMGNYGNFWGAKIVNAARGYEKTGGKVNLTAEEYNTSVRGLGLNPNSKSTSDNLLLGSIHATMQQALVDSFHATGRIATPDERVQIINKAMAQTVQMNTWGSSHSWYPGGDAIASPSSTPIWKLQASDVPNVVVPQDQRKQIIQAARAHNAPVTESMIQSAYLHSLHSPLGTR